MDADEEFWRRSEEARGYAALGLTGLYIVNGGALTALISAFSSEVQVEGIGGMPLAITCAFISFAVGLVTTLGASLFAFFASNGRAPIHENGNIVYRIPVSRADFYETSAKTCGVLGLVSFSSGAVFCGVGLW